MHIGLEKVNHARNPIFPPQLSLNEFAILTSRLS